MKKSPSQTKTTLRIATPFLTGIFMYLLVGNVLQFCEGKEDAENLVLFSVKPYSHLIQ